VHWIVAIAIPASFIALFLVERVAGRGPARPAALIWVAIAAAGFIAVPHLVVRSGLVLDHRIGIVLGGLVGFVLADLIGYITHRARHTVPVLWRWHQLHHSAERVDLAGAAFLHPIDLAIEIAGLVAACSALGLSADAAAIASLTTWIATLIQHTAVRTPSWVGWIVQRPEAHAVHHARGVHAYNYGRLMVWDIVLGTFRNPARFSPDPAGFWDGASRQLGRLLAGRDVGEERRER